MRSPVLSELSAGTVFLKLESEQYTGSFKARGALNKVLALSPAARMVGMITASTGNHALGFARALSITGSKGTIYLPENANPVKVEAIRRFNVPLEFFGKSPLEAEMEAKRVAKEKGKIYVSPYNDPYIIAGQGTIGKEITDTIFRLDDVLATVGGGGLMSGLAIWFNGRIPDAKMHACLPANSAEMALSMEKGEVVVLDEPQETLSDGSAGGLEPGSITFDICRQLVKDYVLVSKDEIASAIRWMGKHHQKIIEGAAGVALAAFLKQPERYKDRTVVIVICGSNIDFESLKSIYCTEG